MRSLTAKLQSAQREKLLRDVWVATDARWYQSVALQLGFETANRLDHTVIRSVGRKEIRELVKQTGAQVTGPDDLKELIDLASDLYFPESHKYEIKMLSTGVIVGRVLRCYVWSNISAAGALPFYQCAAPTRFRGWVDALGVDGDVVADGDIGSCNGSCEIFFKIKWPANASPPEERS